ncbi:MAG: hypothetical protein ACO1PZ_12625, partial [Gammaproteobacteria bacterium]
RDAASLDAEGCKQASGGKRLHRLREFAAQLHPALNFGAACVSLNPPPAAAPARPLEQLLWVPRFLRRIISLHSL